MNIRKKKRRSRKRRGERSKKRRRWKKGMRNKKRKRRKESWVSGVRRVGGSRG